MYVPLQYIHTYIHTHSTTSTTPYRLICSRGNIGDGGGGFTVVGMIDSSSSSCCCCSRQGPAVQDGGVFRWLQQLLINPHLRDGHHVDQISYQQVIVRYSLARRRRDLDRNLQGHARRQDASVRSVIRHRQIERVHPRDQTRVERRDEGFSFRQ